MPGFNQAALSYKVESGNTVLVTIGDQPLAFAQTTNPSWDFGTEALYGIGSAKPQEIQQLRIGPEISIDNFALTAAGQLTIQNSTQFAAILANNQFNISVLNAAQQVRFTFIGAVASNFNESIAANRPITDAIRFMAMDVVNQSGQSILNGPNAFQVTGSLGQLNNGGLGISLSGA